MNRSADTPPSLQPPISWEDGLAAIKAWCRIHRLRKGTGAQGPGGAGIGLTSLLAACSNTAGPSAREAMEHLFDPTKSNPTAKSETWERPRSGDTPEWSIRPLGVEANARMIWSVWQAISRAVAGGVLDGGGAIAPNGRPTARALLQDVSQQEGRRLTGLTERGIRVIMDSLAVQGRISDNGLLGSPFWTHPWVDQEPRAGGYGTDDAEHLNSWLQGLRERARRQATPSDVDLDVLALLVLAVNATVPAYNTDPTDGRDRMPLLAHPFVEIHGMRLMQSIGRIFQAMPHWVDEDDLYPRQTEMARLSLMARCAQDIYRTLEQRPGGWTDREAWGFWRRVRNNFAGAMSDMIPSGRDRVRAAHATCEAAIPDGLVRRDRLILTRTGAIRMDASAQTSRRRRV